MINVPVIELNVTDHCNLCCEDCDHAAGIIPQNVIMPEECLRDLSGLANALHARELNIVGGEPLLHPQLTNVLDACRQSCVADAIILWTNGLLLDEMSPESWQQIDGIVVSIYPSVLYPKDITNLQPLLDKYSIWLKKRHCPEFVRGNTTREITNRRLLQYIYDTCTEAHYFEGHTIRDGRYFKCVQAAYASTRLAAYGIAFDNVANDGVRIIGNWNLEKDIRDYLSSQVPLMACRYCFGDIGRWHPHRQRNSPPAIDPVDIDIKELISDDLMLPECFFNAEDDSKDME